MKSPFFKTFSFVGWLVCIGIESFLFKFLLQSLNLYIRDTNLTSMEFIDEKIENYALAHSKAESEVLKKLNRETYAKVMKRIKPSNISVVEIH